MQYSCGQNELQLIYPTHRCIYRTVFCLVMAIRKKTFNQKQNRPRGIRYPVCIVYVFDNGEHHNCFLSCNHLFTILQHLSVNLTRIIRGFITFGDDIGGPNAYFDKTSDFTNVFSCTIYVFQAVVGELFFVSHYDVVPGSIWQLRSYTGPPWYGAQDGGLQFFPHSSSSLAHVRTFSFASAYNVHDLLTTNYSGWYWKHRCLHSSDFGEDIHSAAHALEILLCFRFLRKCNLYRYTIPCLLQLRVLTCLRNVR